MFLVLRSAIPVLAALPRRSARSVDVFANIIVPFFAIYLAWKLFAEDWLEFETAALDYRVADSMTTALTTGQSSGGLHPDELPISGVTWATIAAALVARYLLSRFKDSLPRWVIGIRVYVDALWVFLTLSFAATQGATFVLDPMGWIGERRIIVWADSIRAELFSYFTPLEILRDAVMAVLRTMFGGATIPLLWLAVASIVYGVSMPDWRDVTRRVVGDRADMVFERADASRRRLSERGWRVDNDVGTRFAGWARARMGNYSNIVDSARLILHGGVLAITLYICGYLALAWLDMAGAFYRPEVSIGYLFRSIA